ncbi:MAG: DNA translocase FtsK [Phycisphaerae bacterium]|nr:DNA translocase FtsK [Phycisphaerae bacterium]
MATKTPSTRRPAASASASDFRALAARRLIWLVGLFIWAAFTASVLSFSQSDPPSHALAPLNPAADVANWMGPAGAALAYQALSMIGSGLWIILICAGVYLALAAFKGGVNHVAVRTIGVIMVALAFSGFHALFVPRWSAFPEGGGGLVAIAGVHELSSRFGSLGAALWLALMAVVGLTVAFDDWFAAVSRIAAKPIDALAKARPALAGFGGLLARAIPARAAARTNDIDDDRNLRTVAAKMKNLPSEIDEELDAEVNTAVEVAAAENEDAAEEFIDDLSAKARRTQSLEENFDAEDTAETDDADPSEEPAEVPFADDADAEESGEPRQLDPVALREKMSKLQVRFAGQERRAATQEDLELLRSQRQSEEEADKKYVFPGLDLLINPDDGYEKELESYVRDQATALETALHTYSIKGEVVGIESGPVITLYQVRLAPGTKVSAITAVSLDIARTLKAVNIRIVPNTEGLDTVGIEVPNRKKEKVRLKELMTQSDATSKMKLPLFLGKDASGRPLIIDLATLPHMLIAGTTGSGKSVCMNAIIMGFLYTQKPSDLKLVLVDPKVVELSQFKDIPHLMCPVVTDMSKAAAILEWAVGKMDERYELLAEAGCRDIATYNSLGWEELKERFNPQSENEEARIPRKLPYMVFVIDELADLMMTNKEVEGSIVRIAQKARAVGIHLILATQRPQANVVTGLIKSNMPGRMSFKVASGMDSRIVLDQKGGEVLLGQGDMLFITPRSATPLRAQGTLVDDLEIRNVVRFVRQISGPSFERQLVQLRPGAVPGEPPADFGTAEDHEKRMLESAQEDPLFDRAVEIVLETQRGSVSLLQRRLAIGYTRASRLIELMGIAGIIGGHKGSVAREVVMTLEEWQAMKKLAQDDAEAKDSSAPAAQPKLFPEPVTAREIVEVRDQRPRAEPPSSTAAESKSIKATDTEDAPFDVEDEDPAVAVAAAPITAAVTAAPPIIEPKPDAMITDDLDEESDADADAEAEASLAELEAEELEAEASADNESSAVAGTDTLVEDDADDEEEAGDAALAEPTASASPGPAANEQAESEDSAESEEEDEFEYEYEYVEVDEGQEVGEEYEVVDEAPEADPDIVVKNPKKNPESAS